METVEKPALKEPGQRAQSRAERRYHERVNQEANEIFQSLSAKFLTIISTCDDPEGNEVTEKWNQLDAQWRTFCKRKNLIAAVYPMMHNYCKSVVDDYFNAKKEAETPTP